MGGNGGVQRTANLVAELAGRKLPHGIDTNPPIGGIGLAMGTIPESCVLTLALGDIGAAQTISMFVFSETMFTMTGNGWQKAGCVAAKYQLSFEARGMDCFIGPENAPYYLTASTGVTAGLATVRDRGPHSANPTNTPF
jgi:hypothetical protein